MPLHLHFHELLHFLTLVTKVPGPSQPKGHVDAGAGLLPGNNLPTCLGGHRTQLDGLCEIYPLGQQEDGVHYKAITTGSTLN